MRDLAWCILLVLMWYCTNWTSFYQAFNHGRNLREGRSLFPNLFMGEIFAIIGNKKLSSTLCLLRINEDYIPYNIAYLDLLCYLHSKISASAIKPTENLQ